MSDKINTVAKILIAMTGDNTEDDTVLKRMYEQSQDTVKGIGGVLVRYGSVDLEGEYFTVDTNYGVSDGDVIPIMFEHEQFADIGSLPIGHASLKFTSKGIEIDESNSSLWIDDEFNRKEFLERVLSSRRRYLDMLDDINWGKAWDSIKQVASGVLEVVQTTEGMGWSSGSSANAKRDMGRITHWPLIEASITGMPAEPKNLAFIKNLDVATLLQHDDNADDRQGTSMDNTTTTDADVADETNDTTAQEQNEQTVTISEDELIEAFSGIEQKFNDKLNELQKSFDERFAALAENMKSVEAEQHAAPVSTFWKRYGETTKSSIESTDQDDVDMRTVKKPTTQKAANSDKSKTNRGTRKFPGSA
ncbi:hypothetical protein N9137_01005 [Pseudomonadales bacterium]|nr:hypothetical protein [Pseudomonadales bacterium]